MQAFRDLVRGWLGKALLILFLVPFALVGIEQAYLTIYERYHAGLAPDHIVIASELHN